jgi:hypothetical protein
MNPQLPFAPDPFFVLEHAWHSPTHGVLQQKPSAQLPLTHSAACAHGRPFDFLQTPAPSHDAPTPQSPAGSVPDATGVHVPFIVPPAATLHATHAVLHAVEQHTPSTHCPLAHWFAPIHAAPASFFATHELPAQYASAAHCESSAHDVPHTTPAHA